jgi:hypothetical protein
MSASDQLYVMLTHSILHVLLAPGLYNCDELWRGVKLPSLREAIKFLRSHEINH